LPGASLRMQIDQELRFIWLGEMRSETLLAVLLILAVVTALYYPVVSYPFVNYDDDVYVTENAHVRAGLSWSTVKWAFASTENANWHPLTWMSHAIDFEFSGPQPGGHHFTSLMLHAVNSVLLFLLALYSTKRWGPSLVLALLFAVHPLNVESVAWVAERKNVLSTFFFFLTLGACGWYARKPHWTRYAMVVIFFVCGLMSKPMLVTLPFVLLLLDYWPLERLGTPHRPIEAGAGKTSAIRALRHQLRNNIPSPTSGPDSGIDGEVSVGGSVGKRDCGLRSLFVEDGLASKTSGVLSTSWGIGQRVECRRLYARAGSHYWHYGWVTQSQIYFDWMVVVFGHVGSGHRIRVCYNAYKSYNSEECHEINPFDGHQHAPAGGKRKASQTHGESAWMDPQRCQCAPGGGRLAPVGIRIHRLSRFAGGPASLPAREHARRMGGHAARQQL
jgi:hypothetical protein